MTRPERPDEEPEQLMRLDRRVLVGIFGGFTLLGSVAGWLTFPGDLGLLVRIVGGAMLGLTTALFLFANRYLAS